jgi:hypothetical protein
MSKEVAVLVKGDLTQRPGRVSQQGKSATAVTMPAGWRGYLT